MSKHFLIPDDATNADRERLEAAWKEIGAPATSQAPNFMDFFRLGNETEAGRSQESGGKQNVIASRHDMMAWLDDRQGNGAMPQWVVIHINTAVTMPPTLAELLVPLRDLSAASILLLVDRQEDSGIKAALADEIRALGFKGLQAGKGFYFDIGQYKDTPDWLNPRNWANPELWDKYRW